MNDIALNLQRTSLGDIFDLAVSAGDLEAEEGLRTAIIISLFTDKRVTKNESLSGSQRGWWGDALAEIVGDRIGSKLWLLEREKQTQETLTKAQEYAIESLGWLIEDEVASKVDVTASYQGIGKMLLQVDVTKPNGEKLNYTFDSAWQTEGAK